MKRKEQPRPLLAKTRRKFCTPIKKSIGVQRPLLADADAVVGGNDEKAARILRVSAGYEIWMLLQPLGVARKPCSGPQTSICLGATWRTGRSRTASVMGRATALPGFQKAMPAV